MSECGQKRGKRRNDCAKETGRGGAKEMPTSNAGNDIVTVFITTLLRMTSV